MNATTSTKTRPTTQGNSGTHPIARAPYSESDIDAAIAFWLADGLLDAPMPTTRVERLACLRIIRHALPVSQLALADWYETLAGEQNASAQCPKCGGNLDTVNARMRGLCDACHELPPSIEADRKAKHGEFLRKAFITRDGAHTKGPWRSITSGDKGNIVISDPTRNWDICHVETMYAPSVEEGFANAAIICAAPEMYAALKRIIEWVDTGCDLSRKSIENAREALKKAEEAR